jgi:tetratricopeptide (TPR) repeat protein
VTVILAPLSFWASPFVSLDLVKTFIIALGTIISVVLLGFVSIKERRLALPPKSITKLSFLLVISLIISTFVSIHAGKSFFGQGFEVSNASFLIMLFVAALVSFTIVSRQRERAVVLYAGIAAAYVIVYIFQLLRIIFGAKFMTLNILSSVASSIMGGWYNLGSFSMVIVIVSLLALILLKLSTKMKSAYTVLLVLSALAAIIVSDSRVWLVSTIVFLGLSIFLSIEKKNLVKPSYSGSKIGLFFKSLSWLPVIAFIVCSIFVWKGAAISNPIIYTTNTGYSELVLPWQMTLDVTASVIQSFPLFGVGPNHFTQAFLAYKPAGINPTDVWSTEFSNGFGLIPSFVATQGLVGAILWVLFFIFFAIASARILRNLPQESDKRFMLISSFIMAVFLWLIAFVSVPSHTIIFYTFVLTGIFFGLASAAGSFPSRVYAPAIGTKMYKVFPIVISILVLVMVVWGVVYIKKTAALADFASGMKQLSVVGNTQAADQYFTKALKLDESDIYWQAKAETALVAAQQLASTVTSTSTASTSQEVLTQITSILNQGLSYAKNAATYDPTNYYNYISQARISEAATNVGMANGYENAVQAYTSAINTNPFNPSIYLSLAGFEARQKKYDESLQVLGKALQVKSNYLDAVFLLSQVYAAKGDVPNAITAAKVAVQLNPQSSLLLFQLGILDYSNKDYAGAAQALDSAIKAQPDYANAKYFLGLSLARLNQNEKAIAQFDDLAKSNSDNQEVALILTNLRAGKSIFADAPTPVVTAPEKRPNLPIKEKPAKVTK